MAFFERNRKRRIIVFYISMRFSRLVGKVKKFVLEQPDVDWFEINQKRYYPGDRSIVRRNKKHFTDQFICTKG